MQHNLQIEELVSQDELEVVYRAIDGRTGRPVRLRRFFPFGPAGRGLDAEERQVFQTVVRRLVRIVHPALCPVVAGGVDPVDGFPFVAVEWVEGESLGTKLRRGKLRAADAIGLLDRLLEAALLVSETFGVDGLWIETMDSSIHWVEREGGEAPVFRIAPIRCLWAGGEWPAARELALLTERMFGWQGVLVPDQAGGGLGGWIKWLRDHPTATIAEISEALAVDTGRKAPPQPLLVKPPKARQPVGLKPAPRGRPGRPLAWALIAAALVGAVGWHWAHNYHRTRPQVVSATSQPKGGVRLQPRGKPPPAGAMLPRQAPVVPPAAAREAVPPKAAGGLSGPPREGSQEVAAGQVFEAGELDLIMGRFHREVLMEGVLVRAGLSGNRRTWYLEFSTIQPPDKSRAFLPVLESDPQADYEQVKQWVGKRIRVRGMVDGEILGPRKTRYPKVLMKSRDALEVLE